MKYALNPEVRVVYLRRLPTYTIALSTLVGRDVLYNQTDILLLLKP